MAECKIVTVKTYTLELTDCEAAYLRGLLQNAILEDEPESLKGYRESIFRAIISTEYEGHN